MRAPLFAAARCHPIAETLPSERFAAELPNGSFGTPGSACRRQSHNAHLERSAGRIPEPRNGLSPRCNGMVEVGGLGTARLGNEKGTIMHRCIRRVVTGHDRRGRAVVVSDGTATQILQRNNRPGVTLTNLWINDGMPAEYDGQTDTCHGPLVLQPPEGGCVFRTVEFKPENPEELAKLDGKSAFAEMAAAENIVEGARHPFMHRTDSLDFAIVLQGEITMLLDDDEVHLSAGDVVIQRGTNHAWSNRGTESCTIAFVLVDGVTRRDAAGDRKRGIPNREVEQTAASRQDSTCGSGK